MACFQKVNELRRSISKCFFAIFNVINATPTDKILRLFTRSLKTHITEFPATKKPRTRAWPAWQVELSGGVNEMEAYALGELAVRDEHEVEPDEE